MPQEQDQYTLRSTESGKRGNDGWLRLLLVGLLGGGSVIGGQVVVDRLRVDNSKDTNAAQTREPSTTTDVAADASTPIPEQEQSVEGAQNLANAQTPIIVIDRDALLDQGKTESEIDDLQTRLDAMVTELDAVEVRVSDENETSLEGMHEFVDGVYVKNIPLAGVSPMRIAGAAGFEENKNTLGVAQNMVAEPGAIRTYTHEEAMENRSAGIVTGRNEGTFVDADGRAQVVPLLANGFAELAFAYATVETPWGQKMVFDDLGPDHSYLLYVKSPEGDAMQNTDLAEKVNQLIVSNYKPGFTGWVTIGVQEGAGSFISEEEVRKSIAAAHGSAKIDGSPTSKGDGGTSGVTIVFFNPVDESITIVRSVLPSDNPYDIEPNDIRLVKLNQNWE